VLPCGWFPISAGKWRHDGRLDAARDATRQRA
jgi:hypothetical protein